MIKIDNISKNFGNHSIFKNYSLEIRDGEFAVFTGASGCGKTTLLNMIGGIENVDEGKIIVNNICITESQNLREYYLNVVGFLFQNFALVENKTIEENLKIIRKKAKSDIEISEALRRVGMAGKEKQKVYSLSGGEQQRVALARLMVKRCSLILADEPTGALDKKNAIQVMEILKSLNEQGRTVIMVTHDNSLITYGSRTVDLSNIHVDTK